MDAQRLRDALRTIETVRGNKFRSGQHLDIRIIGQSCSIVLFEVDELKELIVAALSNSNRAEGE